MLLTINEILERKKERITKETLSAKKKEIIYNLIDKEFNKKYTERLIRDNKSTFYVYYIGDNIDNIDNVCGICVIRHVSNTKSVRKNVLTLLCVRKDLRRKGYGTYLLKKIMGKIKPIGSNKQNYLYTHSVRNSIDFYKSLGFIETDTLCDYMYSLEDIDDDDVILLKIL
jgi:ribosomal protein S18 acetylase RimI-like enzyme